MDVDLKVRPVPESGGTLIEAGVVSRYFSRLGVVAVAVQAGQTVKKNDIIQFGGEGEKHFRVRNVSMERNRSPIETTTGPDHVGIETGCRANQGTRVFIVSGLEAAA